MSPPLLVPGIDPDEVADAFAAAGTPEEFCASPSFDPRFCGQLISAGFLLMSARFDGATLLLPKLHEMRAVLRFEDLRVPRSARRLLSRYELRPNADFDRILQRCAEVHGDDWLTDELLGVFSSLHLPGKLADNRPVPSAEAFTAPRPVPCGAARSLVAFRPVPAGSPVARFISFGVYREGVLVAGEFGSVVGSAYTSYSGYREEDSAGTVQLILTARWLAEAGFAFWDLGMPMEYKTRLGARDLPRAEFLDLFRTARLRSPGLGPGNPPAP